MIHFPLMPVSTPGHLDPKIHMVVKEFESPRDYFNWQTQQAVLDRKWRMATYAECGDVLNGIYSGLVRSGHIPKRKVKL